MIILRTFGAASIEIADSVVVTPNAPRRFAVLLYLAVERGRKVSRDQLTSLVFSDQTSRKAAHRLREVIYELRQSGAPIEGIAHGYMISAKDVRSDYEDALRAPVVEDDAMQAMAGGFLPTFAAPDVGESYSEWLDAFRAGQCAALSRRMLAQVDDAMRAGRWESAQRAARACIGLDPWNERATFALAELLAIGGSKASALQLLDRYIAEVGPQSRDLSARASVLRRRINEGTSAALLGAASRNGVDAFGVGAPRLIGREDEMAGLLGAFERTKSAESQCVVVAGEAGIGKTRLVADFSAIASLRAAHVERVTIQPHDGDRPMGAFVDLVPALLNTGGALGCSPESMGALRNLIGKHAAAGDAPQQIAGAEEHEQRWSAVSRAVVDLCEAIASEQTLVLVIEDAHWLDALSANTIGRIVGTKREARIMVIATTRDPRALVREIRLTERCQTIALAPLVPAAADELLNIVLPTPEKVVREGLPSEGGASIKSRIATISAGNPLFLISLAAHSRAHRGPFQVPGTIVETFAQRIDGLSWRGMSVLATCAELGKHSTIKRLVRSLEMRKHEMVESLLELTDAGLVLREGQSAVPAHPLVAEALRTRLAEPARRAVAHSVAETLEAEAETDHAPALWWDVAACWRVANTPEKVINAVQRCAHHAIEFGRPGEAARILKEASLLPQSSASLRCVAEALMRAADAANDYLLILHGAGLRRRAVQTDTHDELEFAELRAKLRTDQSTDSVERLLTCVCTRRASASHRVDAGIALLKGSHTLGLESVRAHVVAAISSTDLQKVSLLDRLEFELMTAVTAADWSLATETANNILRECQAGRAKGRVNPRYVQNAAIALLYGGRVQEALEAFNAAYSLSVDMDSAHGQLSAAIILATTLLDVGPESDFRFWRDKCTQLVRESPHLASDADIVLSRAAFALESGDTRGVEAALQDGDANNIFATPLRLRWKRAFNLGVRVHGQTLTDRDESLARQILGERATSASGVRDLEMGVACQVLVMRGHAEKAANTLLNYLGAERRHFAPLSPSLARAVESARLRWTDWARDVKRIAPNSPLPRGSVQA